jgi:ATP adenylyltransferase
MNHQQSPHKERLWTPWRMRYIGGEAREEGCIFCNRRSSSDDVTSLILHRAEHAFVIMNLYPYNTGHVMVVPNTHAADLDALDDATVRNMALVLPQVVAALRRVLGCDGFNIGLNLGSVAGAGVAEHLHQHVVPRWEGDANFMPILAGTMVIPEMIPSTYAKVRAELARQMPGAECFDVVAVSGDEEPRFWLRDNAILSVTPEPDTSVARAALGCVQTDGADVVGWSGATSTVDIATRPGLVVHIPGAPAGDGWRAVTQRDLEDGRLDATMRETLERAATHMAPWIAAR